MAKEFFMVGGRAGSLEGFTAEAILEMNISPNLILAQIIGESSRYQRHAQYPEKIVINSGAIFNDIEMDSLAILTKLADDIYIGHPEFETEAEAIAYFKNHKTQVEILNSFDGVMGSLVSGVLGIMDEED